MSVNEEKEEQLDDYDFNSVVHDVMYIHQIVQGLNLKSPSPFDMACIRKTSAEIKLAQQHLSEVFKRLSDILSNDVDALNLEIARHDKLVANRIAYQQHFLRAMDSLTKNIEQCDIKELNRRLEEAGDIYSKSVFKLIDERAELIYNNTVATLSNAIYHASPKEKSDFHKRFDILDKNASDQARALKQVMPSSYVKPPTLIRFENCLLEMIESIGSSTIQDLESRKRKATELLRSKDFQEISEEGESALLRFYEIIGEQIEIKRMRLSKMANKQTGSNEFCSPEEISQPTIGMKAESKLGYTFCPHCSSRVYDFTKCPCLEKNCGIPGARKFRPDEPSPWRENAVRHLEDKD